MIYTSGTPAYAVARRLYQAHQFVRTATVPEYYNAGDDLYIYSRRLRQETAVLENRTPVDQAFGEPGQGFSPAG